MWYYSFVDFLNSYLSFVCTCMFAPTTNDQIYPDISYISPFYLPRKADVTKINILSDYIFLTRGLSFFFFICSWYTLRLSWCNIYSRIGPVHNNWHQCVLNWRCFFFFVDVGGIQVLQTISTISQKFGIYFKIYI